MSATPYDLWIAENYPGNSGYGKCSEAMERMCAAFPELTRVRGHYYDVAWGEREHWWLKDPNGKIVDPTAGQFPTQGRGVYVELAANAPEPTGKCMDCGEYVYDGRNFCGEHCEAAWRAALGV